MLDEEHSTMPLRLSHLHKASQHRSFPVPVISKALFTKAANQNDQLTKLEPLLVLSRCDVPGKALAHPETITEAERNLILRRPLPDMPAATIRKVTDGSMSTIAELVTDHAESLHCLGLRAIVTNYWTGETRLFNIQTEEFHTEANKAAMIMISRPRERALQREALSRLADSALQSKLLAAAGKVDPVSGRLIEKKDNRSSQEKEAIQMGRYAELKALSEDELKELQKLRKRMIMERDMEKKKEAEEAERKTLERKKEEDELLEEERRKGRRKAAGRGRVTAEDDDRESESDDSEQGLFPRSEDTR